MEPLKKRLFKNFGGNKVVAKPVQFADQKKSCGMCLAERERGTTVLTSLLSHGCEVEGKVFVAPARDVTLCGMELGVSLGWFGEPFLYLANYKWPMGCQLKRSFQDFLFILEC